MKLIWMGQGILMVLLTSVQKWDTGFSRGILNFESWYPIWILRKNINFRPWGGGGGAVPKGDH